MSQGTAAAPTVLGVGQAILAFEGSYHDGGADYAASIQTNFMAGRAGNTISSTSHPTEMVFYTTANGSITARKRATLNNYGGLAFHTDPGATYSTVACSVDSIELGSMDFTAGNTQIALKTEGTPLIATAGITQTAVMVMMINGTQYYVFCTAAIA